MLRPVKSGDAHKRPWPDDFTWKQLAISTHLPDSDVYGWRLAQQVQKRPQDWRWYKKALQKYHNEAALQLAKKKSGSFGERPRQVYSVAVLREEPSSWVVELSSLRLPYVLVIDSSSAFAASAASACACTTGACSVGIRTSVWGSGSSGSSVLLVAGGFASFAGQTVSGIHKDETCNEHTRCHVYGL